MMDPMPQDVKRAYESPVREDQARRTKERILAAAAELFLGGGYRSTTIADIARRAEVNVDTIYAVIGRKPDLVRELIERGLSGTDRPVPAADREYVAAIRAASTPAEKLRIYATATRAMHERTARLFGVLADAATTDDAARALHVELRERRARNMHEFVADLAASGGLRPELDLDEAADVVWATNSPEVYRLLVDERGWAPERYEVWLADSWRRLLLQS
jgi:AcrR family transcriptional regulator